MSQHFLVRLTLAACLLLSSGCMSWRPPKFDLNSLRDPRAVDIENRLAEPADTDVKVR